MGKEFHMQEHEYGDEMGKRVAGFRPVFDCFFPSMGKDFHKSEYCANCLTLKLFSHFMFSHRKMGKQFQIFCNSFPIGIHGMHMLFILPVKDDYGHRKGAGLLPAPVIICKADTFISRALYTFQRKLSVCQ